jgi:hypothetical protein
MHHDPGSRTGPARLAAVGEHLLDLGRREPEVLDGFQGGTARLAVASG